jgi:anti-sigma factor (TIGR02949 family)
VDCAEFQEQVSAAVDERLPQDVMSAFMKHAGLCPGCRYEYTMQSAVKILVRKRIRNVETPSGLRNRVTSQILGENSHSSRREEWSWRELFARPYVRPAIAFALTAVAVVLYFSAPPEKSSGIQRASLSAGSVIVQSLDNYQAVMNGRITPQVVSDQPESVLTFFSGKTEFPVLVPRLKSCNLVGGVLNDYSGVPLAHVVYTHDKDLIYMYQACWDKVIAGDVLNLPPRVIDTLNETGWFVETQSDGNTIALWRKGKTLCSAVSRMAKGELVACLTAEESATYDTSW